MDIAGTGMVIMAIFTGTGIFTVVFMEARGVESLTVLDGAVGVLDGGADGESRLLPPILSAVGVLVGAESHTAPDGVGAADGVTADAVAAPSS